MTKIRKNIKYQIIYTILFLVILSLIVFPLAYCYEQVQSITITKEDILNANPTPQPIYLTNREKHAIEVMEKRHFPRSYPELTDSERVKNLEWELFGRIWQFSPKETRLKKLKIASSNACLTGMALPASMSSKRTVKRLRNDDIGLRKKDDVGLIDGFLRLLAPEKYEIYRQHADRRFNDYEW